MSYRFTIESVFTIRGQVYVMTRYLGDESFTMSGQPTLGSVPIENWITQPRKLKPDGTQDPDVFVFVLKNLTDESKIPVGNTIELKL